MDRLPHWDINTWIDAAPTSLQISVLVLVATIVLVHWFSGFFSARRRQSGNHDHP